MTKEEILKEVRRTAAENGGKPLGKNRFESLTGITATDWLRYWSRFSDIQLEAGLEPNKLQGAYDEAYLMEKLVELTREIGRFPTNNDRRRKALNDSNFPSHTVFDRLGNRFTVLSKVLAYIKTKGEPYSDITSIVEPLIDERITSDSDSGLDVETKYGFVYLIKGHPGEYKIGRTNLVDRRISEIGATASIDQTLVHEIKTDDPAGVEAYWHKRFNDKRMRGEWFKLTTADVKSFKRWRKVY